jgi:hypothetical protein
MNGPHESSEEDDQHWMRDNRRSEKEQEPTDATGMQEQTVYVGLERPWDHARQEPSRAGQNDSSAGSVGASAILGGSADRDFPRRKSTKTGETNRRNGEEGYGFITHASLLCTQRVRKAQP